jgi:hypothetical protein
MTKTKGFLLTAGIVLATTFTLSCSDDDSGGSYLSCPEVMEAGEMCKSNYQAEFKACNNNADCEDRVDDKATDCLIDKACGGNSRSSCKAHYDDYDDECDFL